MRKLLLTLLSLVMIAGQLWAQQSVSGRVIDESGNAVANASIVARGTSAGTSTKPDGTFTLSVPANARQLVVSIVGFETSTVSIPSSGSVVITLKAASNELEGVVVTGYQRVKKSEYVGAAARIDRKAIELVPVGSFDQILQGRAPGLRVSAGSGQPGSSASVQIRGPKSISGGSTPLYIVDGVPVEAGVFQSYNPNDFESVDILKDASAAALYGSRGASGVIVVTTKRGKKGSTQVSYRPQFGSTTPGTQKFDMMDAAEFLAFQEKLGPLVSNNLPGWRFSRKNPANASLSAATLASYDRMLDSMRNVNTNWAEIFQRKGKFQSHDLSLSGGTDATRYFASVSYYNEDGIGERSDMERYTLRFNLDHKMDKFTFQLNNTIGYSKRNFIESENGVALANPFAAAYLAAPYDPLFLPNGNVNVGPGKVGPNAYQRIRDIMRYNDQIKATTSIVANYDITEKFFAGGNIGFDFRETVGATYVRPGTFTASQSGFPGNTGSFGESFGRVFQGNGRAYVGFKDVFGKNDEHSLNVTLNAEQIFSKSRSFSYTGYGLNAKLVNTPAGITPGTVDNRLIPGVGGGRSERAYVSQFALVKYSFKNKYILDLSARRDGTSILPAQNRFQNFYAGGLVWNVMEEKFAKGKIFEKFSTLRLRASYGRSANAENFPFGDFGYLPLYGTGSYAGLPTLAPSTPGNDRGTWEYTTKTNIGLEFGLFRDRITGEVNVYDEITNNLFISQGIPIENGSAFTSAQVNAGKMGNKGIEVQLNAEIIRTQDVSWSVGGNFAYNKNEILSLGQEKEYPAGTAIIRVGLPLGSHYVNKWGGVDAATGAPLYYTKDGKLTNVFSSADQVADFGTYFAPWTGGFNTNFRFKNFDLSAFFNFQAKFSRFNNQTFFQENHAFAISGYNLLREMNTMWTKPGDVTNVQSPLFQRQFSSKDIEDASYLRFRNLQVGYTLPRSVAQQLKVIKSFRFYCQMQNLFTWTNFTGFDPEDNNNIAQYEYPLPRTFTVGFNVEF